MIEPRHIWLITVGEPLPLPSRRDRLWRTGLLAKLLAERGHHVTWWTSSVDHFSKTKFSVESQQVSVGERLQLRFLDGMLYKRNISLRRFLNHRQIAAEFRRAAPSMRAPDLILCSYPTIELSAAAVQFGLERDIKVLLDIRDLWPDELTVRLPRVLQPMAELIFWPLFRDAAYALRGASGIIAISENYLDWALKFARGQPGRATVFSSMASTRQAAPSWTRLSDGEFWLPQEQIRKESCVGSPHLRGQHRSIHVIEAARLLQGRMDLQFVLCGRGEREAAWRAQARGLGNVIFPGWADARTLAAFGQSAFVGLAAYKAKALMSLTNKLFEYMSYGLPIVSSLEGKRGR